MPFLDDLIGYKVVAQVGQPALPQRATLCFSGGGVLVFDEPAYNMTVVSLLSDFATASGAITPPALESDQVGYYPAGWATSTLVRLASLDVSHTLKSLKEVSDTDQPRKTITNIGDQDIVFEHRTVDSTQGKQIVCPAETSYTLKPGGSVDVLYDSATELWALMP